MERGLAIVDARDEPGRYRPVTADAVQKKIEDLVTLAADSAASPEEARTAAHQACRLMMRHRVTFYVPTITLPSCDICFAPLEAPVHDHCESIRKLNDQIAVFKKRAAAKREALGIEDEIPF